MHSSLAIPLLKKQLNCIHNCNSLFFFPVWTIHTDVYLMQYDCEDNKKLVFSVNVPARYVSFWESPSCLAGLSDPDNEMKMKLLYLRLNALCNSDYKVVINNPSLGHQVCIFIFTYYCRASNLLLLLYLKM